MNNDADPLLALRQAIKAKTTITYTQNGEPCQNLLDATHLVVSPTCSLEKSAPTRYRKPGVAAAAGSDDFFSVEAIYLAWLLQSAPGADYMKQARENGLAVGFVSVTERKNVVGWLEGKISENDRIVPLVGKCEWLPPMSSNLCRNSGKHNTTGDSAVWFESAACNAA